MIVRSVAQLRLLFERLGFELENQWTSADSTGRAFLWTTLLFRRAAEAPGAGALGRVASIINTDRKVATYKLALIRALCDIAMMSWASAAWESGGVVSVPLAADADRLGGRRAGRQRPWACCNAVRRFEPPAQPGHGSARRYFTLDTPL